MWALLSTRLRTWVLLTVAVPLVSRLLRGAGRQLESRRGPSNLSRGLTKAGDLTGRVARKGARGASGAATDAASGRRGA
ncbi:hypothetical protein [Modestobacter sp. Leaf380]|uniref:hypothetical protein n=1 Tax=Modestobacter sp. Leaf380 TaxID=1736356 RepID=UPI0006F8EFBC|nr:hypothetical protein [Modestobacter sp. Leaf380]KQS67628.1 hypothetical protein ASG41_22630 [Modestobacter sp. Leaf380]